MLFKPAPPVAETAFVAKQLPDGEAIVEGDGGEAVAHLLAVGSGVAIDGRAHPAGDAFQALQSGEPGSHGGVDQGFEVGAGAGDQFALAMA